MAEQDSIASASHATYADTDLAPEPLHRGALSPKRPSFDTQGLADVFPYYAGFSFEWARSQLKVVADGQQLTVLDPWNGSGTTTIAAQANGLTSIGIDLNPIANLVAKLRLALAVDDHLPPSVQPAKAPDCVIEGDPLTAWFSPLTVQHLRAWTSAVTDLSPIASSLTYVSLFRVVKRLTRQFEGSNPTWVRRPSLTESLVHVEAAQLDELVSREQDLLRNRLGIVRYGPAPATIVTASASDVPLADRSVDVILTSPPYLTRIDYAVAYARELAVIGIDIRAKRGFRESLMGTTLTRQIAKEVPNLGPEAQQLLGAVARHDSHASASYYTKQFKQYLLDLTLALKQLTRVAKRDATMIMVVQDSYYKEIPVKLARIYAEQAGRLDWELIREKKFIVNRTLTTINKSAKEYDKGVVAETVLTFCRS